jgi:hypothetical protein
MAIYMLSYSNIKLKVTEKWYNAFGVLIERIQNMQQNGYALKPLDTKCGKVEEDYRNIIKDFYDAAGKLPSIPDLKSYENAFLKAVEENDLEAVKKNYEKFAEYASKFVEFSSLLERKLKEFFYNHKNNFLCALYFIDDFFQSFLADVCSGNCLLLVSGISPLRLIDTLPEEEKKRFGSLLLYFKLKEKYPKLFLPGQIPYISLSLNRDSDSVLTGKIFVDTILNGERVGASSPTIRRDILFYLPFADYHTFFNSVSYKFAKCVKGQQLDSFAGDTTKASFLNCLFKKKDFKRCMEEVYLKSSELPNVRKVWDEFFEYVNVQSIPLDKIDSVVTIIDKVKGKKYIEVFPSIKKCCEGSGCDKAATIDINTFDKCCRYAEVENVLRTCEDAERKLANSCAFCYIVQEGKVGVGGDKCVTPAYAQCIPLYSVIDEIFQQLGKKREGFCQAMRDYINSCKNQASLKCGNIAQFCEKYLSFDGANRRKDLPPLSQDDLDSIVPDEEINCPSVK